MSRENILNYEVQMIDYHSGGLSKPNTSPNYQYTIWELHQKIYEAMGRSSSIVRWIGNGQSSYLDSFVYVLLSISLKNEELIIKLKEYLYEFSRRYLQKSNQKLLVQFLCLVQYTKDKFNFLRKYPEVTKLIVSILKFYENETLDKQNSKITNFTLESPIKVKRKQRFSLFCSKFNFLSVSQPNEYSYKFKCNDEVIYLIIEKQCFFIVEGASKFVNQKQNSVQKNSNQYKNSTPRFCPLTNTLNKKNSDKKGHQHHLIHESNRNDNFLDLLSNDQSQDCSLEEIKKTQKMIKLDDSPHKKLNFDNIKTQPYIGRKQLCIGRTKLEKNKKIPKKQDNNQQYIIKKLRQSQEKRQELWQKLQQEYYLKKKQISEKTKINRMNKRHKKNVTGLKLFKSKHEGPQSEKQRKQSFNSFSGLSIRDRYDSEYFQSEYDAKSTTKSHEQNRKKSLLKLRKVPSRQSPNETLRKENKNRLSIIQEQNRMKFWNSLNKSNNIHRSPKIPSASTSNRETLDANVFVTFNYVNKNGQIYSNQTSPKIHLHKYQYYGSPIRV